MDLDITAVILLIAATGSVFGGSALVIWVSARAKIALLREKTMVQSDQQPLSVSQEGAVLTELKAMRQQMAEMHSTGHEFNISFDEALNRLSSRVERLETKSAASVATTPTEATLRNGNSSTP